MPNPLLLPLLNWARKLRYPVLFKLTAALFAFSVLLPPGIDPIPFLDEIVFGLGTLLLANWKTRKPPAVGEKPPIDGEVHR
ncbi:DUF6116 family protein [Thermomonas carbonis]|uniref:Uncharacterized protein n=1 Tax=Thermomonas carbonis TaxID=1463158 RepID=A0A7G9SMZ2_9GAMM|nr:DUF6116 family protein [Thermomonas carbonis]QNN69217.1 hypothetical protein H9L16_11035 [Thermomonas carbonis]GHC05964.1 hypothetical protein GCM10010080_19890 [Thermomonas carbonis]